MLPIIRMNIDRARCIRDHVYFKTLLNRVERCRPDTVILSQPADPESFYFRFAKAVREIGSTECGIAFFIGVFGLVDNLDVRGKPQIRMKSRAGSSLHAMRRPGTAPIFKTDVISGMPVPRRKYRNPPGVRLVDPSV